MYCTSCGKEIVSQAKFCKYCGNCVAVPAVSTQGQLKATNVQANDKLISDLALLYEKMKWIEQELMYIEMCNYLSLHDAVSLKGTWEYAKEVGFNPYSLKTFHIVKLCNQYKKALRKRGFKPSLRVKVYQNYIKQIENEIQTEIINYMGLFKILPERYWNSEYIMYLHALYSEGRVKDMNTALNKLDEQIHRWKMLDQLQTQQTQLSEIQRLVSNISIWY